MPRATDTETRTIAVAVLKAGAGVLLILWLTVLTAFMLLSWSFDGPLSLKIARGAILVLSAWIGQSWRTVIGMTPAMRGLLHDRVTVSVSCR